MAVSYNASDIEVLEGLEPVRKRPGMFIAGTDTPAGLHQLVFEILDNSVDEAMNGYADQITVILHRGHSSTTIADNGRGIPVDKHPKFKKSALELILTTLHAGGKFSDKNYKTAGGLHGVGSSVVNALSEEMIVRVKREGKEYEQHYSRGAAKSAVRTINSAARGTGTSIFFRPDPEIFPSTEFSAETIRQMLQVKAYLTPGLRITFSDEDAQSEEEFYYEDGLRAYLTQIIAERKAKVVGDEVFFIEKKNSVQVTIALVWTESTREEFYSYVNGIHTSDGGSHENGAKLGIVKAVRNYLNVHDIAQKGVRVGAEDIREGLICLAAVRLPGETYKLQFQGQTKSKLNNPEVAPIVENAARSLEQLMNEKPSAAQAVVNRIMLAAKARAASRAAVDTVRRKIGISHRLTLPGKLADCTSTRPEESELFIVEGDSAGGSTKQGRNRYFQAVLPLRGKVLNTIVSSSKKIVENKELSNILSALGCGTGDSFNLNKLRYEKVIILTDADADGMHIATLLLAFFFTSMRPLIENGCLYLGKPPLYGVFGTNRTKKQKSAAREAKTEKTNNAQRRKAKEPAKKDDAPSALWAYSDAELAKLIREHGANPSRVVRYKGLGEMNPETLWETTLDPKRRTLLRVSMDDEAAVSDAFGTLMGSDPSTRYQLICENAEGLELDI